MIAHSHAMGYEVSANLMAVSAITEMEIDTVLKAIAGSPAKTMVIVDSYGYLYREQMIVHQPIARDPEDTTPRFGMIVHHTDAQRE